MQNAKFIINMRKFCKNTNRQTTDIFAKCTHKHTTQTVPRNMDCEGNTQHLYNCIG